MFHIYQMLFIIIFLNQFYFQSLNSFLNCWQFCFSANLWSHWAVFDITCRKIYITNFWLERHFYCRLWFMSSILRRTMMMLCSIWVIRALLSTFCSTDRHCLLLLVVFLSKFRSIFRFCVTLHCKQSLNMILIRRNFWREYRHLRPTAELSATAAIINC